MGAYNNDNDYSLDGVPYSEYERKSEKEYELQKHERDSCIDIRKRINEGKYTDADQIREHIEWLENLIEKVSNILKIESNQGVSNLSLQRDFSKVKILYNDLSRVLDKLETF